MLLLQIPGLVNVDFADVCAIMKASGSSLMGQGRGQGKGRARDAALNAISSPLLDARIERATGIVWNITGPSDLTLFEVSWPPVGRRACLKNMCMPSKSGQQVALSGLYCGRTQIWGCAHFVSQTKLLTQDSEGLAYELKKTCTIGRKPYWGVGITYRFMQVNEAAEVIYEMVDPEADLIFGAVIDSALDQDVSITLIATGFGVGAFSGSSSAQYLGQKLPAVQPSQLNRERFVSETSFLDWNWPGCTIYLP